MAGHMGDKLRSIQNLEIVKTDLDNELIYLKGSIPGSKNTEVLLKKAVKNMLYLTRLKDGVMLSEFSYQAILISSLMKSCL